MNQTRHPLSNIWNRIQSALPPCLQEELGELTEKQQQLIDVLEPAQIEAHIPYVGRVPRRPLESGMYPKKWTSVQTTNFSGSN